MDSELITIPETRLLRIRHYPDPVLRRKAQPVPRVDDEIRRLVDRMVHVMVQEGGVGLAAPQVGVPLRIVVISLTGKPEDAEAFINPDLTHFEGASEVEEGCLSVPGVRAKVRRPAACTVQALDIDENPFHLDATDLAATVFQHETDHLNGTLFIDRLTNVARLGARRALKQLENAAKR